MGHLKPPRGDLRRGAARRSSARPRRPLAPRRATNKRSEAGALLRAEGARVSGSFFKLLHKAI
eukprot:scaffold1179_cov118-Isochrysis_galbana.AAC.7